MSSNVIGVLGATSLVGESLLTLAQQQGFDVCAFSRQPSSGASSVGNVRWVHLPEDGKLEYPRQIALWISLAPIWVLPHFFDSLGTLGARRIIALSSTSVFTKSESSDQREQELAVRLREGENRFMVWADRENIRWTLLRPTLIYKAGRDRNISTIAAFIRRFGFFPVLGNANGLRQPIHADDVASACLQALQRQACFNKSYNLSGPQTLSYQDMVGKVFEEMGKPKRIIRMPRALFRTAVCVLRLIPRFNKLSVAMADRMNQDLVFDSAAAMHDFDFAPLVRGYLE